jgi:hypothetical protein
LTAILPLKSRHVVPLTKSYCAINENRHVFTGCAKAVVNREGGIDEVFVRVCFINIGCFFAISHPALADIITIDVQAQIDGRDLLSIDGNTLQWHHLDYAAVGRYGGNFNEPTIISTTLNGSPVLTNYDWYPEWPEPPPAQIRYRADSSVFTGLMPSLPPHGYGVGLDVVSARDSLSIYSLPSAANNYALTLDFNDDPSGAVAWYEAKVTIDTSGTSPVPELSTWAMMALGLVILGFARYRASRKDRRLRPNALALF